MKCVNLLACVFISLFCFSCTDRKERINKIWEIEETIDYQNFSDDDRTKLDDVIESFISEQKRNSSDWNSGFSQQCTVMKQLYFYKHLSKEEYLKECIKIYERYTPIKDKISFQTCGYAVCLYYSGEKEKSLELFSRILESDCKNNFEYESVYEGVVILATKILDKDTKDVKNYELFNEIYPLEEDEIILNFVGW